MSYLLVAGKCIADLDPIGNLLALIGVLTFRKRWNHREDRFVSECALLDRIFRNSPKSNV
jgi:hypothetical protein